MTVQMEKMMKMMDKKFEAEKRHLEVNMGHPIILNLSKYFKKIKNINF